MPAEACGLAVTTLVIVDGGSDKTDQVAKDSGAVTFVLQREPRARLRAPRRLRPVHRARRAVRGDARRRRPERPGRDPGHAPPLVDDELGLRGRLARARAGHHDGPLPQGRRPRLLPGHERHGRTKLTDSSNGYRALRVTMLDDVAHRLVQPQYQTAELLIIAMKRGWRVTERPTVWLPRASGTTKKGKN